jgi:hypothetical protein
VDARGGAVPGAAAGPGPDADSGYRREAIRADGQDVRSQLEHDLGRCLGRRRADGRLVASDLDEGLPPQRRRRAPEDEGRRHRPAGRSDRRRRRADRSCPGLVAGGQRARQLGLLRDHAQGRAWERGAPHARRPLGLARAESFRRQRKQSTRLGRDCERRSGSGPWAWSWPWPRAGARPARRALRAFAVQLGVELEHDLGRRLGEDRPEERLVANAVCEAGEGGRGRRAAEAHLRRRRHRR